MRVDEVKWDAAGLVAVVVQDRHLGDIRMVAYANREALEKTIESREAHFFSRSRGSLWKKGETSGNVLHVAEIWGDCDGDAILYLVDPDGPSCHTGERVCFFRRLDADAEPGQLAEPSLLRLERALDARRSTASEKSYTRSLLDKGAAKIGEKLVEEAGELTRAIDGEADDRVDSEAGDLLYHMLVALIFRRRPLRATLEVLGKRFGVSGHDEKASRTKA